VTHRWPLPRWLLTLVVGACVLALPLAALPTVAAAIIHCCCGDHDAAHRCACNDCPAKHDGAAPQHDATIKSCNGASLELTLGGQPALAPAVAARILDRVTPAIAPAPITPRRLLPEPPPSPPPRG